MNDRREGFRRRAWLVSAVVAAVGWRAARAAEAAFPSRALRLVVPFAAGGPADHVARAVAPALARSLGHPVVVENRTGGDGTVGALAVRHAAPDGHTLLLASASLVPTALLRSPPPFDLGADFAPVSRLAPSVWAMYASTQSELRTVADVVTQARAQPGALHYASSTHVDRLAAEQFMQATGSRLVRVPYKGIAQALPDLMAGRVALNFSPLSVAALQQVRAGALRLLGVYGAQRSPLAPEVPTMTEAGVPGLAVPGWLAIVAPPGTPPTVVERLHGAVSTALADAEVAALLARQSAPPEGSTPQALAAQIDADLRLWRAFIRDHGLTAE